MTLSEYLCAQLHEACDSDNKWFCSEHFGREVQDPRELMEYYIKHGGSEHFAETHRCELECISFNSN